MKSKILSFLLIAILFAGCSGSYTDGKYTECFDCTQFPLVYQGTIQQITQGHYISTACITIDLKEIIGGSGSFNIGDIIQVGYKIKQGEFCQPETDRSIYQVSTVPPDSGAAEEPVILVPGSAIEILP